MSDMVLNSDIYVVAKKIKVLFLAGVSTTVAC